MSAESAGSSTTLAVWALGLTQIIGYGTLYYSFGALAPGMAADFGWSEEWVFGVLSASLLIGGLIAPVSGAWADRFGAAKIMVWGSLGAALALTFCALAPERISFVIGLVALEIASAFVLYATAFAALAQLSHGRAQRSITHLTLIAGFASTIFWPITSALHEHLSWREIYLIYAALNVVVCLPLHLWLTRHTTRRHTDHPATASVVAPLTNTSNERAASVLMLSGFAMLGFVSSAILVQMVPLLGALGLGGAGVFVTTLFGPAQVLSRVVNMQFGKALSQPALAVVATALMPAGLLILALSAPWLLGVAAFAVLFGLGSGLSSIVSGTLPLALFGSAGYGRRLGSISSARLVISSIAPFAFSLALAAGPARLAICLVAAAGLLGTMCFGAIWWMFRADPRTS